MSPADYGPNGGAAFDDLMLQLMEAHQPQASPTSRDTLSALPRRKVRPAGAVSEGFSNTPSDQPAACACGEPCSVCHDGMEEGLEVVELPCQHCYHEDCITAWLKDVSLLVMVMASLFSVVASPCCAPIAQYTPQWLFMFCWLSWPYTRLALPSF